MDQKILDNFGVALGEHAEALAALTPSLETVPTVTPEVLEATRRLALTMENLSRSFAAFSTAFLAEPQG